MKVSKLIKVKKKTNHTQNRPQQLGYGVEFIIQKSETALKSQCMHLTWHVQNNGELISTLIRDYQRGSVELSL